jgi:Pyruvate/2-oxoacid:ferredoxin oxidoreductase delta subunit
MDLQAQEGLLSTWREGWRTRNVVAVILSLALVAFYVVLYFGGSTHFGVAIPDVFQPLAEKLHLKSKWLLYGALYSVAMITGAVYYLRRHGNSRYNQVRIATNVAIQVVLAFSLPLALVALGKPDVYPSYFWPLKYDAFYRYNVVDRPVLLVVYFVVGSFLLAPMLAFLFGKRWYCSWVCGCGGLANTFGDPWRHLTSKSKRSWRFERVSVHTVLAIAVLSTAIIVLDWTTGGQHGAFSTFAGHVQGAYGFVVGAVLAGVVGTGLYPILGPRVWCRNFCPMAALLGLEQMLGRFRIRVKDDMCISCGNCSAYCEMGIDVRAYAQTNQSFTRAACVGCGMCAHVCPRGVLRLENRSWGWKKRYAVRLDV